MPTLKPPSETRRTQLLDWLGSHGIGPERVPDRPGACTVTREWVQEQRQCMPEPVMVHVGYLIHCDEAVLDDDGKPVLDPDLQRLVTAPRLLLTGTPPPGWVDDEWDAYSWLRGLDVMPHCLTCTCGPTSGESP